MSEASRRIRLRVRWLVSAVILVVVPTAVLSAVFVHAVAEREVPVEPEAYFEAAERILRGESPYAFVDDAGLIAGDGYVYPPVIAVLTTPMTILPELAAGLLMAVVVLASVLAIPYVLGVRDWRCYGIALLWPAVLLGVQTGNVNALLALAAALVWRFRDRPARAGVALGSAFAAKLLLWPLGVWLAATRRTSAAIWALASAATLTVAAWAVVLFHGFGAYPALLRRVSSLMDDRGYSLFALASELGASDLLAKAIWAALAAAVVAAVVVVARRGDDRAAFVLAVAASLAVTPVVWLHYFVFLLPVIALVQPRLGPLWFLPLAMFVTEGGNDPGLLSTSATLAVATATFGLALRELPLARRSTSTRVPLEAEVA